MLYSNTKKLQDSHIYSSLVSLVPKGKKLTTEQIETNRSISSFHVLIEQSNGGAKKKTGVFTHLLQQKKDISGELHIPPYNHDRQDTNTRRWHIVHGFRMYRVKEPDNCKTKIFSF